MFEEKITCWLFVSTLSVESKGALRRSVEGLRCDFVWVNSRVGEFIFPALVRLEWRDYNLCFAFLYSEF